MTKLKSRAVYLVLLLVQLSGALFIILEGLPEFRHLMNYPGEQLPFERSDNLAAPTMILAMQVAYWYRLRRVPLPPQLDFGRFMRRRRARSPYDARYGAEFLYCLGAAET